MEENKKTILYFNGVAIIFDKKDEHFEKFCNQYPAAKIIDEDQCKVLNAKIINVVDGKFQIENSNVELSRLEMPNLSEVMANISFAPATIPHRSMRKKNGGSKKVRDIAKQRRKNKAAKKARKRNR